MDFWPPMSSDFSESAMYRTLAMPYVWLFSSAFSPPTGDWHVRAAAARHAHSHCCSVGKSGIVLPQPLVVRHMLHHTHEEQNHQVITHGSSPSRKQKRCSNRASFRLALSVFWCWSCKLWKRVFLNQTQCTSASSSLHSLILPVVADPA